MYDSCSNASYLQWYGYITDSMVFGNLSHKTFVTTTQLAATGFEHIEAAKVGKPPNHPPTYPPTYLKTHSVSFKPPPSLLSFYKQHLIPTALFSSTHQPTNPPTTTLPKNRTNPKK